VEELEFAQDQLKNKGNQQAEAKSKGDLTSKLTKTNKEPCYHNWGYKLDRVQHNKPITKGR
jgi:hypothetical protein